MLDPLLCAYEFGMRNLRYALAARHGTRKRSGDPCGVRLDASSRRLNVASDRPNVRARVSNTVVNADTGSVGRSVSEAGKRSETARAHRLVMEGVVQKKAEPQRALQLRRDRSGGSRRRGRRRSCKISAANCTRPTPGAVPRPDHGGRCQDAFWCRDSRKTCRQRDPTAAFMRGDFRPIDGLERESPNPHGRPLPEGLAHAMHVLEDPAPVIRANEAILTFTHSHAIARLGEEPLRLCGRCDEPRYAWIRRRDSFAAQCHGA
jgi:hypothetical protein